MKREERNAARKLREEGKSMSEIVQILGVAKSSVSMWVRDIVLSETQRCGLSCRGRSIDSIEKRRVSRISNTRERHQKIVTEASRDIGELSRRDLFLIGTALYWGEGSKTQRSSASVANADPNVIMLMMRFFREICAVPEQKFSGHIHTFSHLNSAEAEEYWSQVSGVPQKQFYKTYAKPSIASKGKRDTLPYGTFAIYVCDTNLFMKIKGWIEGIASAGDDKNYA